MKKTLLLGSTALSLLIAIAASPFIQAAEKPLGVSPALRAAQTHQELQAASTALVKAEEGFAAAIQSSLKETAAHQAMVAQMEAARRPEILIPKFLSVYKQYKQAGSAPLSLAKTAGASAVNAISGMVTVDGEVPEYPVYVLAFDQYGYFRGDCGGSVSETGGAYTIADLPPGEYYIQTASESYVDEIYKNQLLRLDSRELWRQAEKVPVLEGQITTGIDFDLQSGAKLAGTVSYADGAPVQGLTLHFVFTTKDSPVPVYTAEVYTEYGSFPELDDLSVPLVGEYKVSVQLVEDENSVQTWYPNHVEWAQGETITIPAYDAVINNLSFKLAEQSVSTLMGSISGNYRWSDTAQLISVAIVYLFDANDSSLADLSLGLFGNYSFPSVPPGQYILYLDDQLGNLTGGVNYLGQYYSGAQTPGAATRITVGEGEEVKLKDIVLEPGGVLSGTIKSASGELLDGVWVLAIDASLMELKLAPWLENLHLFIGQADDKGDYTLAGLPSGKYIVRTISDTLINQTVQDLIKITSGAHAGEVVDAWYGGSANLFDVRTAAPVQVVAPNATENIDFTLEKAKWIRGRITDSFTDTGKSFYRIFAMDANSAWPYLSLGMLIHSNQMDSAGYYRLGPLPSGSFKLLAMAPFSGFNNYLSEMYGGGRDFSTAAVVQIGDSDLDNVDFNVERGAAIEGFIDLPQEGGGTIRAGEDVLDGFPVIVYEAATGKVASLDFVQFSGGYRVDHLLPGTYKILALPVIAPYAATWYGGGGTFNAASTSVTVGYGETVTCDITLESGTGAITGSVHASASQEPLSQVMIIAYDQTGHPVGLSMSDMDLATGTVTSENGQFMIPGLRPGHYYLRTYAITSVLGLADQLLGFYGALAPAGDQEVDYLDLILGGGLGSLGSIFDLGMTVYRDTWHSSVPARLELDLNSLALTVLAYGVPSEYDQALLPIYLPMPLAETIPAGAVPVTVTEGSMVTGLAFLLSEGALSDVMVNVEEKPEMLPESFAVHANYPNPFNPTTTLAFDLPAAGEAQVVIYDALGRQIRVVQDGLLPAGQHRLQWDGRDDSGALAPSGLYFARFRTSAASQTIKMVMMK